MNKIKKVHCFFEQSGTFKNEFIKLGIPAEDYDIQNHFNQTDHIEDLFTEINKAYKDEASLFDKIDKEDLVVAFFPCIYFCANAQLNMLTKTYNKYKNHSTKEVYKHILKRSNDRTHFYNLLLKLFCVIKTKNLRMIVENPWTGAGYLKNNFDPPTLIDNNRMLRGDYFKKPTAYWFINIKPTQGFCYQKDKKQKFISKMKEGVKAGICSKERSMISKDYARNFICDFIIGKQQHNSLNLF